MNKVRKQRLLVIIGVLAALAIAVALVLNALRQNINLFYTPQQVVNGDAPVGSHMRVGGLVVKGSLSRNPKTLDATFDVTDGKGTFTVHYKGILPDLFREGKGIVANGTLVSRHQFEADQVLAKHDANYMPPEVKDALRKAGHLGKEDEAAAPKDNHDKPEVRPGDSG